MNNYTLNMHNYTINELSEMSGISPASLRDRLRRGYSVEEAVKPIPTHTSVLAFCDASWYLDWIGMSVSYLHEIYYKWCISNGYEPIGKQAFSRQIKSMYPIKTISTKRYNSSERIIRLI